MRCEDIEDQILDYQENPLSPAQRAVVAAHLAGCAKCQAFARQWEDLDLALTVQLQAPALSAAFDQRLQTRLQAVAAELSAEQRAERQRQLQAEFAAGLARIRRGAFATGSLFDHLTWPALTVLAGWLAWVFAAQLATHFGFHGLTPSLLPSLSASTVILALGLAGWLSPRWEQRDVG